MIKPNLVLKQVPGRCQTDLSAKTSQCLREAPEDRQEKITSLSKAIRSNSYRLDCRKLADCLIASLLFGLLR